MNKHNLWASGAAIMLLAACQPAPNDTVAVPTTANTNAVNTVAAASATAKAAPTATQPAPTATPLPTATRAPTQTPEPAPTRAPDDAAPWAGKLKRIPGASDPDGFVYEVPPEAMAGIEDWVRRIRDFANRANESPSAMRDVTSEMLQSVFTGAQLDASISGRKKATSLLVMKTSVKFDKVIGLAADGMSMKIVYEQTPLEAAKEFDKATLKTIRTQQFTQRKITAILQFSQSDGYWRVSKILGGASQ